MNIAPKTLVFYFNFYLLTSIVYTRDSVRCNIAICNLCDESSSVPYSHASQVINTCFLCIRCAWNLVRTRSKGENSRTTRYLLFIQFDANEKRELESEDTNYKNIAECFASPLASIWSHWGNYTNCNFLMNYIFFSVLRVVDGRPLYFPPFAHSAASPVRCHYPKCGYNIQWIHLTLCTYYGYLIDAHTKATVNEYGDGRALKIYTYIHKLYTKI